MPPKKLYVSLSASGTVTRAKWIHQSLQSSPLFCTRSCFVRAVLGRRSYPLQYQPLVNRNGLQYNSRRRQSGRVYDRRYWCQPIYADGCNRDRHYSTSIKCRYPSIPSHMLTQLPVAVLQNLGLGCRRSSPSKPDLHSSAEGSRQRHAREKRAVVYLAGGRDSYVNESSKEAVVSSMAPEADRDTYSRVYPRLALARVLAVWWSLHWQRASTMRPKE